MARLETPVSVTRCFYRRVLLMWLIENGDKSPPTFDGAIFTSQLQHAKPLLN
jgi:hypothetical protein